MTITKTKVIDEIREITAEQVAKKQDAAKLNFPAIIEKMKSAAKFGDSSLRLPESGLNAYDLKLLREEGFNVYLIDEPYTNNRLKEFDTYKQKPIKVWEIRW